MKPARTFVGAAVLVAVMAGNAAADFGDPFPGAGTDSFPSDLTHTVQFIANPLGLPVGTFPLTANGPTEVVRGDPYPGGPGSRYQIDTEIVSMNLTGTTPFGPITVRESPWYD
ncbi:MAG: hypothetical protein GY778_01150, partial [bacterium]|nr:hypothetical protein [bacterium]